MNRYAFRECLDKNDIKMIRKKMKLTQKEFAALINVSVKSVERWETSENPITGPVVTLIKLLSDEPELMQRLEVPERTLPMRLWYYHRNFVCTIIDVDERKRKVLVHNYTKDYMMRAFGSAQEVTYEQYEEFLESRCFPAQRDKMKLILKELDLPFYDPIMIIEKTAGKMAEDDFWIEIER